MWSMEKPATKVAEMLWASGEQIVPAEVLRIDDNVASIVVDVDGVDYILTMMRVPKQRPRPLVQ
jgi:hypothetical protein